MLVAASHMDSAGTGHTSPSLKRGDLIPRVKGGAKGYTIEELRRTVGPIAESHGMRRVYLFGSRARGDHREDSDYDF